MTHRITLSVATAALLHIVRYGRPDMLMSVPERPCGGIDELADGKDHERLGAGRVAVTEEGQSADGIAVNVKKMGIESTVFHRVTRFSMSLSAGPPRRSPSAAIRDNICPIEDETRARGPAGAG